MPSRTTHASRLCGLGLCLVTSACHLGTVRPSHAIVLGPPAPPPTPMTLAIADDYALAARLAPGAPAGPHTVELRDLSHQTRTVAVFDSSASAEAGRGFSVPTPWNGELRLTSGAGPDQTVSTRFVGVVIQPVLSRRTDKTQKADKRPAIIVGPNGRTTVLLTDAVSPPVGTQVAITSPALSAAPPPARVVGDTVEIGLQPAPPTGAPAVVGLVPFLPPAKARLSLSVFDPATKRWSPLPSYAAHDGTVFARCTLPGVFAVMVAP